MFRRRGSEGKAASAISEVGIAGPRYRMIERIATRGDDFFIYDDQGQRVFMVDGKKRRVREALILRDMCGAELCRIQHRVERTSDLMEIAEPNGRCAASVQRTLITPLRDRYVVKIGEEDVFEVAGNIVAYEYRIGDIAKISKSWFRTRDSYGVEVAAGQNVALILAATVCIDQMTSELI
jgi:uncharacterized protein YxjI